MLTDKRLALKTLCSNDKDLRNRLFFSARNLAIEAVLLRLENLLLREGFPAKCEWSESSFGGPTLNVMLANPKPSVGGWVFGTCRLRIKRESEKAPDDLSSCFYTLDAVDTSEYWRGRQPAKLLAFRDRVQALHDEGVLAAEIMKVNFPFEYTSHSGF